jgi:hypothetical protein
VVQRNIAIWRNRAKAGSNPIAYCTAMSAENPLVGISTLPLITSTIVALR